MKKLIFLSLLAIAVTTSGFAQDKASDLKRLLKLMNAEATIDQMTDNLKSVFKQQAFGLFDGEDASEQIDKFMNFVMDEVKELSKKMIDVEMVTIYDKHFTHDEVKDLIKFYESPTGKKLLEKSPAMTKELMNLMAKYMPEIQEKMSKHIEELF